MPSPGFLLLVLVVIPACFAVLLGMVDMRTMPRALFTCRRCGRDFRRKAHRPYAAACPRCGARDWYLPG